MKIFISWSGERSRLVAELLNSWVKCVIQASKPWISTQDIESGSTWFSEISNELNEASIGIICLTKANKNNPWILFEAGALAKGLELPRVCTLLVDLEHHDIKDPLAQFNHTTPTNKESMRKLVRMINSRMSENKLEEKILDTVFDTYWNQFEAKFDEIIRHSPDSPSEPERSSDDMLTEVLEATRTFSKRLSSLESGLREDRFNSAISELVDVEEVPPWFYEDNANNNVTKEMLSMRDRLRKATSNSLNAKQVERAFNSRTKKKEE